MGIKHRADSAFRKFWVLCKLGFGLTVKCFDMPYVSYPRPLFQKETDGLEIIFRFDNTEKYSTLKLSFEAKGLQSDWFDIPSSINFRNEIIFLENSPIDGSYDNYTFEIDNTHAYDSILIKTTNAGLDITEDDWEFNALYLEGIPN